MKTGEWWPRHHAWTVLQRRKADANIDKMALALRDLRDGPTCNKRRHGLMLVQQYGRGAQALAAIDAAANRRDNSCIRWGDFNAARNAVRGR